MNSSLEDIKKWHESTVMRNKLYRHGRTIRYDILKKIFNYQEKKTKLDDVLIPMREVKKVNL